MNPLPKLITSQEDSGVQFRANNQRYEESIHMKEDKKKKKILQKSAHCWGIKDNREFVEVCFPTATQLVPGST